MAKRADANQPEIVVALRKMGALVLHLHEVGKGCPDLLIGYHGKLMLVEVKDGSKSASKRKLTPDEERFHQSWKGYVVVITSVADVIELIFRIGER